MAIRRWDSKESWNLSMSLGRARGKELTWWIKILTNCPVEWLKREKKTPETLPLKICIILMCMKEWNKKVFFCGNQPGARYPGLWLHLSSIPRLENDLDVGWWALWLGDPTGTSWHVQWRLAGEHCHRLCLGVVTGWRFKIIPKLRRNTPEYLHGCSQSK